MPSSKKKMVTQEVVDPVVDYSEIKGDDVELFAIRVPPGFDYHHLDGLRFDTAGSSTQGDGFTLREAPVVESEALLSAFPSAKKNRWVAAKPFVRQLVVSMPPPEQAAAAESLPPPLPPVPQIQGLRLRRVLQSELPPRPSSAPAAAPSSANASAAMPRKRKQGGDDSVAERAEETAIEREERKAAKRAKKAAKEAKRASLGH